jgi:hypothetical protein
LANCIGCTDTTAGAADIVATVAPGGAAAGTASATAAVAATAAATNT